MNRKPAAILDSAKDVASSIANWADLSNALFSPVDGLIAKAYPTREERDAFMKTAEYGAIRKLLQAAMDRSGLVDGATPHKSGRRPKSFPSGAVRSNDADGTRFDLITPIGLRRLAETCAEGARKYGPYNWQKGIPASEMLNHAIRHIYLWLAGDDEEDHLAHAAWNLLAVCHFEEVLPETIDVPARNK